MSLLLHLSDLHLGNSVEEDLVGDYKVEAIREQDRTRRTTLMRSTLAALAERLRADGETLDAVVITGDVTTRGRRDGFEALTPLLQTLGDRLPGPERIVVVPGNHDVAWYTGSGTPNRYEAFVEKVRAAGYVTPLLDGIDYDRDEPLPTADPLLIGPDFVVVAVNSADASGLLEPLPTDAQEELDRLVGAKVIGPALDAALRGVRTYDMSRVSARQMDALGARVRALDPALVRIAALHHQLVPVSEQEEAKPFESMVNLGAFLAFLGAARVDVVAHGHKHVDAVRPLALNGPDGRPRGAVVSSCGTIGGQTGAGHEIARLIRVDSSLPTLRRVTVSSVPAVGAGGSLSGSSVKMVHDGPTWRDEQGPAVHVVDGGTATDVHERLLELATDGQSRPRRDVVCVVRDGPSALTAPASYPFEGTPEELTEWFDEIVAWWQDGKRAPGKPFTHGQRLRDWQSEGRDQIEAMIAILANKVSTSRAVAVLIDPVEDRVEDKALDFPSFSLLHLWIEDERLHCTAFFRKQEMNFWWAINVAEIAQVQRTVVDRLKVNEERLASGSIRTHASEAVFSDRLPKVNVPLIDRMSWTDPQRLQVLAVSIADVGLAGRDDDVTLALRLLQDWAPDADEAPVDGAPVPAHGLALLTEAVTALAARYPRSPAGEAAQLLGDLAQANENYSHARQSGDTRRAYADWRARVLPKIDRLRRLLTDGGPA